MNGFALTVSILYRSIHQARRAQMLDRVAVVQSEAVQTIGGGMKNGRPFAPRTAAEVRERVSYEIVQKARPARLRLLWRLHKACAEADRLAVESARIAAISEQTRLQAEQLALKKADYRLRFASKPLGVQALLKENERLKKEIAELRMLVGSNPIADKSAA